MERVTFESPFESPFKSQGVPLAGDLYLPSDLGAGERRPAVVVTGSWTTVKEQMPALYARRVAAEGWIALAFDFRGYGESGGTPRDFESPTLKAQDIAAAATFLAGHPRVEPGKVGALPICASTGYTARALALGAPLRSLALVAPWLHDAEIVAEIYGGPAGVAERIAKGEAARRRFEATGEVEYVPAVSTTDPAAAMYGPFDYYLDPARGAIPEWSNRFAVLGWPEWLGFDAMEAAPGIAVPTLVVHSEEAAIPHGARRFAARMRQAPTQIWISGTQFDFYDQDRTVSQAVEHAMAHFRRTLV